MFRLAVEKLKNLIPFNKDPIEEPKQVPAEILVNQKLFKSWTFILGQCLKDHPATSTACNEIYSGYSRQKAVLLQKENEFLNSLASSHDQKLEEFDSFFDNELMPIRFTGKVQNLKTEIQEDTRRFLQIRHAFELFRNKKLKKAVKPHEEFSTLDGNERVNNAKLYFLLSKDYRKSKEEILSIEESLLRNETAPFTTEAEMYNSRLTEFPDIRYERRGPR